MKDLFPTCPTLPEPAKSMTWRDLSAYRENLGEEFYLVALQYGHYLWKQGNSARAILALDRALYADLDGNEQILSDWPLPYQAIGWMIRNNPEDTFIGNPRVHYQHLADRVKGHAQNIKKWRAWACWHITRMVAPELPFDPKHKVTEPTESIIRENLIRYGIPQDVPSWQSAIAHFQNARQRLR